jgi:hypothetical protein
MHQSTAISWVYFVGGLGFLSNFGSVLSYLFGSLLMLVACLTWLRQLEHQHNKSSDTIKQV